MSIESINAAIQRIVAANVAFFKEKGPFTAGQRRDVDLTMDAGKERDSKSDRSDSAKPKSGDRGDSI